MSRGIQERLFKFQRGAIYRLFLRSSHTDSQDCQEVLMDMALDVENEKITDAANSCVISYQLTSTLPIHPTTQVELSFPIQRRKDTCVR